MSEEPLPASARVHVYLGRAGLVLAGLGIIGFAVSLADVASAERAAIDVHTDIPWVAYFAIGAWALGSLLTWVARASLRRATGQPREAEEPGD